MRTQHSGFTLIELVMVIVILGILAAVALPRFANLGSSARLASLQGAYGAVQSSEAIVHSAALAAGTAYTASSTVSLEGTIINTAYGYPDTSPTGFALAAQLSPANYTIITSTVQVVGAPGSCTFTYTAATSTAQPSLSAITSTGC